MRFFKHGLKLDPKKEATLITWKITRPAPPGRVRIPLSQPPDPPARPLVKVGERVLMGEKIAEPEGALSVSLHAPISGTVSAVDWFPHPFLEESRSIEITSDGKNMPVLGMGLERPDWDSLSPSQVGQILQESGVVDMDGKMLPVHFQIDSALPFVIDALILNGCESEPYLTRDHALMMSHPVEILRGGEILRRAAGAREFVIALDDPKREIAELFKSKLFFNPWSQARIELLPTGYPQGEEKLLIRQLLGRLVPPGKSAWEAGGLVFNVATAFAVFEAVVLQKPLLERVVTVGGECVVEPKNLWLRTGTPVADAVKHVRGFLRQPEKLILGGPMKGKAVSNLEVPVLKGTGGILGLPREVAKTEKTEPCIRCGCCIDACPVSISPVMITLAAEKGLFEMAQDYGASYCIECGNCAYVCPSKRPMVELIQSANAPHPSLSPEGRGWG